MVAEPFRQWVIEDAFAGPRPAWDKAGALMVPDAGPHEAVKLRLLNGTHSMLAYVGGLAGVRTVAGAWGDPAVAEVGDLLGTDDLEPTLPEAPGIEIAAYRAELGRRWINPRIPTGSSRSAPTARRSCPRGSPSPPAGGWRTGAPPRWIALVMAAWARHLQARRRRPARSTTPAPSPCRRRSPRAATTAPRPRAVLAVLGEEVAGSEPMHDLVVDWLARLDADGIAGALKEAVRG